ncbi:hypothetical protein [Ureibacillus aquaedulcis]|uniref:Uncharacterized protein n=1 Tax=Ureibacillus aquaedulcis TaxID=3058421 RepID=A0ABT8GQC9_9BACL|nr:hypothetical protein [Ureibacillus sp. BA0131]MDN4493592.1 hypothetical protein [Ureibacillus sp. BA0131]
MDEQILELLQKMNTRLDRMEERFDKLEVLMSRNPNLLDETTEARDKEIEELKKG